MHDDESREMARGEVGSRRLTLYGGAANNVASNGDRSRYRKSDRCRVDPIRIGGPSRPAAVSLNTGGHEGGSIEIPEPEPRFAASTDWREIIHAAGLSRIEARVFLRCFRDALPIGHLHRELGVTAHAARQIYLRVVERIRGARLPMKPVTDSLRPAYREQLGSGRRPWSLGTLGPDFAEIMGAEKYFGLISERVTDNFRKTRRFYPLDDRRHFMKAVPFDLSERLDTARERHSQLVAERNALDVLVTQLRKDLNDAETAAKNESEQAMIDRRAPSERILAEPAMLTAKLHSAWSRFHTASGAVKRQYETVERLTSELSAAHRSIALARVRPMAAEFETLLDELALRAVQILATQDGEILFTQEIFSPQVGMVHDAQARVLNILRQFARDKAMFSPELRRKLEPAGRRVLGLEWEEPDKEDVA